jgi:hypothetical protein
VEIAVEQSDDQPGREEERGGRQSGRAPFQRPSVR